MILIVISTLVLIRLSVARSAFPEPRLPNTHPAFSIVRMARDSTVEDPTGRAFKPYF